MVGPCSMLGLSSAIPRIRQSLHSIDRFCKVRVPDSDGSPTASAQEPWPSDRHRLPPAFYLSDHMHSRDCNGISTGWGGFGQPANKLRSQLENCALRILYFRVILAFLPLWCGVCVFRV